MSEAPPGWMEGRVEDFFFLQRGFDITENEATVGNVPVISSSGLSYYHNEARVQPPGVVTGRKGKLGGVYYIDTPFWPHDTTLWVKDFKGNNPAFVAIFLEFLRLERLDAATSVPTLNRNNVHKRVVTFPPLSEQCKIAAILGTWDEAIALVKHLITALQARKKGLMQCLLTGRVRFQRFVKTVDVQQAELGQLPADWCYEPTGKIARQVSVKNEDEKDLPVLSCTKHEGLVDSLEYFGRQIFSDDLSVYKIVRRGQFAYATNHIEEGSIGYQDLYDEAVISPMYTVFATNTRVNDSFLYKVLKTEMYRHIFEKRTIGTVNRRGSLRWNDFSQIRVPLPDVEEQEAIAEVLDTADREIELVERLGHQLREQKQGLMQRLLTGQIRVQVDEADAQLDPPPVEQTTQLSLPFGS